MCLIAAEEERHVRPARRLWARLRNRAADVMIALLLEDAARAQLLCVSA
jgi:hypothetical protein